MFANSTTEKVTDTWLKAMQADKNARQEERKKKRGRSQVKKKLHNN